MAPVRHMLVSIICFEKVGQPDDRRIWALLSHSPPLQRKIYVS